MSDDQDSEDRELDGDESTPEVSHSNLAAYIAVEHPGQINNVDRAVTGLGGHAALKRLVDNPILNKLELRFRPQNRFEHPIQSATVKTNNLLLKISKRRDSTGKTHLDHRPIARINHTVRFRDICDFQWTTKHSPFVQKLDKALAARDANEMAQFNLDHEKDAKSDDLDILPPPIFSPTVVQHSYNYKQNPAAKKTQTAHGVKYVNRMRGLKQHLLLATFEDESVPKEPSSKLPKTPSAEVQIVIDRLKVLFEERPIWTRRGLTNNLNGIGNHYNLKFALPYVSYMWKSGPWRDCYAKYGLDPRSDDIYAAYQAVYCIHRTMQSDEGNKDIKPSDSHIFDGRTLYPVGRTFMFIDMTDPVLLQMRTDAPKRPKAHARDGWWYPSMITATRAVLKAKIASLSAGKIPSDLEFTDIMRTATHIDGDKDSSPQNLERERSTAPTAFDEDEREDSEEAEEDKPEDESELALDRRVESLLADMIRPGNQFNVGSAGDKDALDNIEKGIFGSDAD